MAPEKYSTKTAAGAVAGAARKSNRQAGKASRSSQEYPDGWQNVRMTH